MNEQQTAHIQSLWDAYFNHLDQCLFSVAAGQD